ncbi:MAG: hypothetical protein AABZ30_11615 [Myxococcota bacterium]
MTRTQWQRRLVVALLGAGACGGGNEDANHNGGAGDGGGTADRDGAGDGGGTADRDGAAHDGGAPATCEPLLQVDDATASGLEICSDERVRSTSDPTCLPVAPEDVPTCDLTPEDKNWQYGNCHEDADCVAPERGTCVGTYEACYCGATVCAEDADCGEGFVCLCTARLPEEGGWRAWVGRNACVPGNCGSDADCGGARCEASAGGGCCPPTQFRGLFCRTAADTCASHADCPPVYVENEGYDVPQVCAYDAAAGRWACEPELGCACE